MAMKLDFDNPNRDYLIDSYLSALSDKMGDTNEKEQEVSEDAGTDRQAGSVGKDVL